MNRSPLLRLFGHPTLFGADGRPVPFRTRKHLALLVVLHLDARQQPLSRHRLIDMLWPDVAPEQGRHSLSQALSAIRTRLGDDTVSRGGDGVQLLRPVETDLDRLAAVERFGGNSAEPLAELEACAGAEFAHWVDTARQRCLREAAETLRHQLQAARTQGDVSLVHDRAALLYAIDPLSDDAVQALAEQQLLVGDEIAAIRLLRTHVERVREALGCDPHPELRRLLERLESGARPSPTLLTETLSRVPPRADVFIGREKELARLEAVWAQARAGRLVTVMLTGAPGLGKTALVERFATSVEARTWPALLVTCREIGQNIPFSAFADLVYAIAKDPRAGSTDPEWLAEASRLAPGLRATYSGVRAPPEIPTDSVRLRAAEALIQMLEAVADDGPLLLSFDNLHHIDSASAAILHVAVRRAQQHRFMVLATARASYDTPFDSPHSPRGALDWDVILPIAQLDTNQGLTLVRELAAAHELAMPTDVLQETADLAQGIPYLTETLFSDWRENQTESLVARRVDGTAGDSSWHPSETMRRAFARHYSGLPGGAQSVLNLLAVAGRPFEVHLLNQLLQLEDAESTTICIRLLQQGIVRFAGNRLDFKNEVHRAFVYHAMDSDTQRYLHRTLAAWLEGFKGPHGTTALERAHHLGRSGDMQEAVASAVAGGRVALEAGAYPEVERSLIPLLQATSGNGRDELSVLVGRAQCSMGRYREALETIESLSFPRGADTPQALAVAAIRAEALQRGRLATDQEIRSAVQVFLRSAVRRESAEDRLHAIQLSLEVATDAGSLEDIQTLLGEAERLSDDERLTTTAGPAAMVRGYSYLLLRDYRRALSCFSAAATSFRAVRSLTQLRQCLNGMGVACEGLGEHEAGVAFIREAIGIAQEAGNADGIVNSWSNLGSLLQELGDVSGTVRALRAAVQGLEEGRNPRRAAEVYTNAAGAMIATGRLQTASRFLRKAGECAEQARSWQLLLNVWLAKADLLLATGDIHAALASFAEAERFKGEKQVFFINQASYHRLKRHQIWHTQGFEAVRLYGQSSQAKNAARALGVLVETRLFEEWIRFQEEGAWGPRVRRIWDVISHRRLFGIPLYLSAIGVGLPCEVQRREGVPGRYAFEQWIALPSEPEVETFRQMAE